MSMRRAFILLLCVLLGALAFVRAQEREQAGPQARIDGGNMAAGGARGNMAGPAIAVRVVGPPELAIPSSAYLDRIPGVGFSTNDVPPRAYRDASGLIHFFGNNSANLAFTGPSFDRLKQDTKSVYPSHFNKDPQNFAYKEWVMPPYAVGGNRVFALIHNEFHALLTNNPDYAACSRNQKAGNQTCWYSSTQRAESIDGGYTFTSPPPPANFLFGIPYRFSTDMIRAGIGADTMIKSPVDGYYYALLGAAKYKAQQAGTCVARSKDLNTWNFWTGKDWSGTFVNPYVSTEAPENHVCPPVTGTSKTSRGVLYSLVYDEKHRVFAAVIRSGSIFPNGPGVTFSYITSPDLIHWSEAAPFFSQSDDSNDKRPISYGSFIDTDSTSLNFDVTDGSLYFYYMRWPNGLADNRHRDLMRVPVRFSSPGEDTTVAPTNARRQ